MSKPVLSAVAVSVLALAATAQEPSRPAASTPDATPTSATTPAHAEWTLDNGVTISTLWAPDAPLQHTITFLPHGLLDDGPGHTQRSHFVEHLILRHTDPDGLFGDGFELNGETTTRSIHLDTYAEPRAWRTTLERHATWLQPHEVTEAILMQEQEAVAQEVLGLAAVGSSHKWADAAWVQVVRFGAEHVDVVGDVRACTAREATTALAAITGVRPGVHVAVVGPLPPNVVRAAVDEILGAVPALPRTEASPEAGAELAPDPDAVRAPGARRATWDLPSRHYVEWYPLPDRDVIDRAAGEVLAIRLNTRLALDPDIRAAGVFAIAGADLVTPEGRFLRITVGLPGEVELEPVTRAIHAAVPDVLESGVGAAPLGMFLYQWAMNAVADPDPGAFRRERARTGPVDDRLEADFGISPMHKQLASDLTREQRLEGLRGLDLERLQEIVDGFLTEARRGSLLLTPRD